jgi:hypothetical protein
LVSIRTKWSICKKTNAPILQSFLRRDIEAIFFYIVNNKWRDQQVSFMEDFSGEKIFEVYGEDLNFKRRIAR